MINQEARLNGRAPAYPQPATPAGYRAKWSEGQGGLSKREHIATELMKGIVSNGRSMQGIVAACSKAAKDHEFPMILSQLTIVYADALLEELEK